MSENLLRHLIALGATLVCVVSFFAGYVSGTHGWWWIAFGLIIIYFVVLKIIDSFF